MFSNQGTFWPIRISGAPNFDRKSGIRRGAASSARATISQRVFFISVILMGYGQYLLPGADKDAGTGSPLTNVLWGLADLVAFIGLLKDWADVRKLLLDWAPLVFITALAILSTLWSVEPALTARRSLELFGTSILALFLVRRFGLRNFLETLAIVLAAAGLVSLFIVVLFPAIGTADDYDGAWTGFFNHKNALGLAMVLALLTVACIIDGSSGLLRRIEIGVLIVSFVLLLGSKSAGAYASALMLAIVAPFLLWSRRMQRSRPVVLVAIGLVISTLVVCTILGLDMNDVLGVFGKEATLTGRTELWQLVVKAIAQRPLLGYGFGVFWGSDGPAAALVYPGISNHWEPQSAHNGFLETPLNTGILGGVALVYFLGVGLFRAMLQFWRGKDGSSVWPLFAMLAVIIANLSEATFEMYNLVDWIILVAAFIFATEAGKRQKRDAEIRIARGAPFLSPIEVDEAQSGPVINADNRFVLKVVVEKNSSLWIRQNIRAHTKGLHFSQSAHLWNISCAVMFQ